MNGNYVTPARHSLHDPFRYLAGLALEFADDGLNLGIGGVGQFSRQWDELAGFTNTNKGFLFYFTDGTKNWLPNRVFESGVERGTFLEFLESHKAARQGEP